MVGWVNASRHSCMERSRNVGATDAGILFASALSETGSPGQTAAPIAGVTQLPSAHNIVHGSAGIAHELLALSEGQFIDGVEDPYMVPVEIDRPIRNPMIDRIVVIVIVVGVREGVVSQELKAAREPLSLVSLRTRCTCSRRRCHSSCRGQIRSECMSYQSHRVRTGGGAGSAMLVG